MTAISILTIIYIACGGLIIGSFLNMVLARMNTGLSWGGRSRCMTCSHTLTVRDLIPLVSFLWNRGRCRHCGVGIAPQYLIIEILMAIIAVGLWLMFGVSIIFFTYLAISAILLVVTWYDIKHMIILDTTLLLLFGIGIVGIFFVPNIGITYDLVVGSFWLERFLAMMAIPFPFFILWVISRGAWLGLGDVKLMAWIGLMVGVLGGVEIMFISFWLGGLWALGILILRFMASRMKNVSSEFLKAIQKPQIPFGPFLVAGYLLYVFGVHFLGILL